MMTSVVRELRRSALASTGAAAFRAFAHWRLGLRRRPRNFSTQSTGLLTHEPD